ncbi:MAG: hypothetical protein A3E82_06945 [Gammaproteobacteria bacterium RIFCSPHIGHO2_12_FULL_38_11]|nr:MAG: hypothetical protein A3E82_06945 [Gammaproteobacteria bacterium RIFCSPHIGHO2_12_FULL_38_11]
MNCKFRNFLFTLGLIFSSITLAGPWLLPGNLAVKSDVDLLADAGLIKAPVMTWPIAWVNIGPVLLSPDVKEKLLTEPKTVQDAYQRILTLYQQSYQPYKVQTSAYASASNRLNPFRTFQYQPYADFASGVSAAYQMKHFADSLNISYYSAPNQSYSPYAHIDNSYAYLLWGNWALGFDQFNRWWGPGYSDAMILSQNAEPFPAIGLQRMNAQAFKTKWLHWIGPWSFSSVVSEDGPSYYPYPTGVDNILFWFTNISVRPLESLQFDVSRNVLFSGEQRPLTWAMLENVLTFRNADDAKYVSDPNVPGSEEWDIGAKLSLLSALRVPVTLYEQTLFSDHEGGAIPFPSRTDFLLGSSLVIQTKSGSLRTYIEYEYNIEYRYYWWGIDPGYTTPPANTYGGQYPYTYYNNILSTSLGAEGIGYTLGAIFNENGGDSDDAMIRFLQPNSQNWGIAGTPGYPFAQQNLIWVSFGRTVVLPHHIGSLVSEIGYLAALSGINSLSSGFSATFTWSKIF